MCPTSTYRPVVVPAMAKEQRNVQLRQLLPQQQKTSDSDSTSSSSRSSLNEASPPSSFASAAAASRSLSRNSFRRTLIMHNHKNWPSGNSSRGTKPLQAEQEEHPADEREQGSGRLGGGPSRKSLLALKNRRMKARSAATYASCTSISPSPPSPSRRSSWKRRRDRKWIDLHPREDPALLKM